MASPRRGSPAPGPAASRRERPSKPALSRPGIIDTAVAVLRAEGLEKVTMRRLARELDTGPASLYVYVADTADLHAAVLDQLLGEVDLGAGAGAGDPEADTDGGDWRERLTAVLISYVQVLLAHPTLARSAVTARPSGEHYLRLLERLLALLDAGGVPPERAAWGVNVLLQVATATAAEHSGHARSPGSGTEWDSLTRALRDVPEATHPHIRGLAGSLLAGSPRDRVSWCFLMLINGIAGTPVPDEESGKA
jgi:AcrR family transcriptional regulator